MGQDRIEQRISNPQHAFHKTAEITEQQCVERFLRFLSLARNSPCFPAFSGKNGPKVDQVTTGSDLAITPLSVAIISST
jgi:hypothetical protein